MGKSYLFDNFEFVVI